ncbi:4-hydroxy-3-methylbut-2-enyl diphosphate reductase [Modestobacter sp. VKM Ac-2983]|uniref:4-hydroxy-3-methylbut-2-enyl diphosphate reductase n=1 Tax=Modestobacter sp. VKM Ac-2983 TaxID=3004137 RepID=UPI0022AB68EA|nr:4-hydroxy-3-methylbut-2-enyl diphosphate reductase [Modestobacter sp. VKM Ac-2983]MCZ2805409.1 4-hydroxy-3-methylbut-2-enyl diphosphate reductase [Modestobacter sp. VKM Ac-2983]
MSGAADRAAAPLVATPLRTEHAAVAPALRGTPVVRTGRGARSTAWARDRAAGPVLVAGVAGALSPDLRPGDLVVADRVTDGTTTVPSPAAPLLAGALTRRGLPVHVGTLATSPSVVTGAARTALAATGALAVDTETLPLASAAGGSPFAAVRAVVDTPTAPLLHPGTPGRGLTALRTLRAAAPAMAEWLAALGPREVLLASPRSFCAGVTRAIDTVERELQRHEGPVYVRRQIVHNAHVVRGLEQRGAVFVEEVDDVPAGSPLVLAAHGVAPAVHAAAADRGLAVVDATCPLVSKVHAEVRRAARRGETVLLIGHREHEEVEGTVGEAPDDVVVVADVDEARAVAVRDPERVSYAVQTTLAVDEAEAVAAVLRDRFPALRAPRRDDICYATTNRQQAVRALAAQADLVLVVGSSNSSNSVRLVEVARRAGCPAHLVEDAGQVDLRWLAGAGRIGLSAGASAPPHLVDDLVTCLSGLGPVRVQDVHVTDEDVTFTLPPEVS